MVLETPVEFSTILPENKLIGKERVQTLVNRHGEETFIEGIKEYKKSSKKISKKQYRNCVHFSYKKSLYSIIHRTNKQHTQKIQNTFEISLHIKRTKIYHNIITQILPKNNSL